MVPQKILEKKADLLVDEATVLPIFFPILNKILLIHFNINILKILYKISLILFNFFLTNSE